MANRSYLYAADSAPGPNTPPKPIRCISEHNWSIPLIHQLLAGRGTRVGPSIIWDHPIGISADYAGGVELATRFLRVLGEGDTPEHAEVRERALFITDFLADPKRVSRYFLLETGEIIDLDGQDLREGVRWVAEDLIPGGVARAEKAIAGDDPEWLAHILASWRDNIDSFYSDVLYFSFNS
jgi:hypothetical protein